MECCMSMMRKNGNVGLVEPDPSGFQLISSFKVEKGTGPHWSHPYLYEGKYVSQAWGCPDGFIA